MKIGDLVIGGQIRARAIVVQQKTGRSVQFELLTDARASLLTWLKRRGGTIGDYVFPSRVDRTDHLSTRQYARLVDEWVSVSDYAVRSMAPIRFAGQRHRSSTRPPATFAPPPELDDHRLLGRRKDGTTGIARPHGCIARGLASPPLGDSFWVQLVASREGPGAFFRPLEHGSDTRRHSGAAVKNCCHSASSHSGVSVAPSHPETKHLGVDVEDALILAESTEI